MDTPSIFDPATVGTFYKPRLIEFYSLGKASGISAADTDKTKTLALSIDNENDFIIPGWALPVPGAVEDSLRFVQWGYRNVENITAFLSTKDKHQRKSIFHASGWVNEAGEHPKPFEFITLTDVLAGKWRSTIDVAWSIQYLTELERGGKRKLQIWPDHCVEDTDGQKLLPAIEEMITFHAGARNATPLEHDKGISVYTEHFGAIQAEVPYPGEYDITGTDYRLLRYMNRFDRIVVAGQAKGHCVVETLDQMVINRPELATKMYVLTDCMSAIAGTEESAEREFARLERLGVTFVTSQDNIF